MRRQKAKPIETDRDRTDAIPVASAAKNMSESLPPNPRSTREALFATTAALALSAKTLHLLQAEVPGEILVPIINDLANAWETLHSWQAERDLEKLLVTLDWSHPAQTLTLPCSDFEDLLHLCEKRLANQPGGIADPILAATRNKLKRAIALNRKAAERRAARRRSQQG